MPGELNGVRPILERYELPYQRLRERFAMGAPPIGPRHEGDHHPLFRRGFIADVRIEFLPELAAGGREELVNAIRDDLFRNAGDGPRAFGVFPFGENRFLLTKRFDGDRKVPMRPGASGPYVRDRIVLSKVQASVVRAAHRLNRAPFEAVENGPGLRHEPLWSLEPTRAGVWSIPSGWLDTLTYRTVSNHLDMLEMQWELAKRVERRADKAEAAFLAAYPRYVTA